MYFTYFHLETFGPDRRPIVEFALENIEKLQLQNMRKELAKEKQNRPPKDTTQYTSDKEPHGGRAPKRAKKEKNQREISNDNNVARFGIREEPKKGGRVPKREKKGNKNATKFQEGKKDLSEKVQDGNKMGGKHTKVVGKVFAYNSIYSNNFDQTPQMPFCIKLDGYNI
jgi:nucleolar protein 4